jgi:hypothetical protein
MKSKPSSPSEHYKLEKERRAGEAKPEHDLLADAKREYLAMLEAAAAKGKGGRPKKAKKKPVAADEIDETEDVDRPDNGIDSSLDE